jgi:predicted nucleotidyltransferase
MGRDLASVLRKRVVSAVIFGSMTRGEEGPGSDLDLCCIVRNDRQMETARESLEKAAGRFRQSYGIHIAPIYFTVEALRRKRRALLVKQLLDDGQLIAGIALRKVLHG